MKRAKAHIISNRILGLATGFGSTLMAFVVSYSPGLYLPFIRIGAIILLVLVAVAALALYFANIRKLRFVEGLCTGFIVASALLVGMVWVAKTGMI